MTKKPLVHYHADCDYFGGSENMIANFLNDNRISKMFDVSISYRSGRRYAEGLKSRVQAGYVDQSLPLVSGSLLSESTSKLPWPLAPMAWGFAHILGFKYFVILWNTLLLAISWRRKGISILHINNGGYPGALSCQAAVIAAYFLGIKKVLMVVNNIAVSYGTYRRRFDLPIDKFIAGNVTLFITGSLHARDALANVLNLPSPKVIALHNGIASRASKESREAVRKRLGVSGQGLVFGVVAILEHWKGHHILIEAISILRSKLSGIAMPLLLIEGDGTERSSLQVMIDEFDLSDFVFLIGHEKNIFDFLRSVDVVVLPSIGGEDFPNVVLEAMSLGKAVIASRLAGTSEQVLNDETGYLVPPGNATLLAESIARFCFEPELAVQMGRPANSRFNALFTSEVAVGRYIDLYSKLLKES